MLDAFVTAHLHGRLSDPLSSLVIRYRLTLRMEVGPWFLQDLLGRSGGYGVGALLRLSRQLFDVCGH